MRILLLPLLLALACTDKGDDTGDETPPELEAGFGSRLSRESGCADVVLYASNEDDTLALHFQEDRGIVAEAHEAGESRSLSWELASEQPTELIVTLGSALTRLTCTDVYIEEPVIERSWIPVAGTATLTVTPTGEGEPWDQPTDGQLELEGVEWVPEDDPEATPVPMGSFSLEASVGWLPG